MVKQEQGLFSSESELKVMQDNQKNDTIQQQQFVPLLKDSQMNDMVEQQQSSPPLKMKPNEEIADGNKNVTNQNADPYHRDLIHIMSFYGR